MAKIEERRGSYTTRVSLTDTLTGKRTQKRVTARTKAELRAKVREYENRNERGDPIEPDKTRLSDWLDTWLPLYRKDAGSQFNRSQAVRLHLKPDELADIPIGRLRRAHIQAFVDRKIDSVSPNHLEMILSTLSLALNAAVVRGIITVNPCDHLEKPVRSKTEWTVLSEEEARSLIEMSRDDELSAFWPIAVSLGTRRGELLALRWSDVDLKRGLLTIQRTMKRRIKDPKTGTGEWFIGSIPKSHAGNRTLRLPQVCLGALQTHRTRWVERKLAAGDAWSSDDAVFDDGLGGYRRGPDKPTRDLNRLKRQLHLADTLRVHDLRHTAATHMLMHSIPVATVSRILGHANPSITYRMYAHVIASMEEEAVARIDAQYATLIDQDELGIVTNS